MVLTVNKPLHVREQLVGNCARKCQVSETITRMMFTLEYFNLVIGDTDCCLCFYKLSDTDFQPELEVMFERTHGPCCCFSGSQEFEEKRQSIDFITMKINQIVLREN